MQQPWVCANAASHLCLQCVHYSSFVTNCQFRRIQSRRHVGALVASPLQTITQDSQFKIWSTITGNFNKFSISSLLAQK